MSAPTNTPATALPRLARVLGLPVESLPPLDALADNDLETLTVLVTRAVSDHDNEMFARTAALAKILPGPVAGKIAERVLPAALAARIAEHLEPRRAAMLVSTVSVGYLADVAVALDPQRAVAVISGIAIDRIRLVAIELFRRDDLAAMAAFVDAVSDDALFAALDVASGDQLLRIGPMLVWSPRVEAVLDQVDDHHLDAVLTAAIPEQRWAEAAHLLGKVPDSTRQRIAARIAVAQQPVRDALEQAAASGVLPKPLYDTLV